MKNKHPFWMKLDWRGARPLTLRELIMKSNFSTMMKYIIAFDKKMTNQASHFYRACECIRDMKVKYNPDYLLAKDYCGWPDVGILEGNPWRELIGSPVRRDKDLHCTDTQLAAHCLWHLTFYGYTPKEQRENADQENERLEREMRNDELCLCDDIYTDEEIKEITENPPVSFYYIFTTFPKRVSFRCSFVAQTTHLNMEYTTENTYLQIVRMKDDNENGGLGAALKRSLAPSQFYVIEKKPEIASSFYHGLAEPTLVFTQTRSAQKFLLELVLSKVEPKDGCLFYKRKTKHAHTGSFNVDALCKQINVLENRQMWIDDSEIQSVTELCEKCRQAKEEHHIQFVVIDDFLHLPIPESVQRGLEAPDATYRQLCQLAKELNIVLVALLDSSVGHTDEDHPSHQKKKHTQAKGLNAILKAAYAEQP